MIDLDKLDELHQEGEWDSVAPIFVPEHGCVQCHQPWPCQVARLSKELRMAYERIEQLEWCPP